MTDESRFLIFPFTLTIFRLPEKYNLNGTSLKSGLKCEHKYWNRLIHQFNTIT